MANAVDERIVAAKFDSSDFEKGVDRTIKKLDELEEKLDMKDVGKGLEESSKKTQKATESLSKSIENLENRFTSFMGLVKQKTLESLADAVVNSFWKMEKATLGFFRSMTTGQVSAGMDKYESMLTSVRMITNSTFFATDADKKAGKKTYYKQEDAYASMAKLQDYADETSYSMEQMTDAMSKMVAAGVSLRQAERNVQGIANACANAGVNATDASRAFFNLSQAYSTGFLKYTDYRSLELLNLTNESFQDQLLAAGVAAGVLEESTDKNGNKSYKTKKTDKNGKVTAGKKFTRQGLSESLKYNWADKNVMDALFGDQYYVDVDDFYDAQEDETGRKRTTEERIKFLSDIVDESKIAAKASDKEVEEIMKNFDEADKRRTDYEALKTTKEKKEYLKKMREDEEIQTQLIDKETEKIVDSLDDADKRKQELAKRTDPEARSKYLAELRQEDDIMAKLPKKYSEVAIKAFMAAREARNFNDVIKAVADFVSSKFSKVFGDSIGKLDEAAEFFTALSEGGIAGIFTGIAEYVEDVFKQFDSNGSGMGGKAFRDLLLEIDSAVGMLSDTFSSFMPGAESLGDWLYKFIADLSVTVQHMQIYIAQFQGWLAQTDGSMTRLEKIRAVLGNIFGVFGAIGKAIGVAFDAIRKGLDLLTPVFDLVINLVTELTKPIGQLGSREYTAPFDKISNAINNVYQVLKPVSDLLSPFISKLGTILGQVGAFFLQGSIDAFVMNFEFVGDLIKFIVDLFGPDDMKAVMKGNDVLGDIVNTINAFKQVCSDAFGAVKQFFGTLISDLRKFAGLEESGEGEGVFSGIKNFFDTNDFINNAKAWFEQAKKDIVVWFKGLPQKIGDFFNDLLYDKELVSYMDKGNAKSKYVTVDSPLKQRIDAIIEATRTFLKELPGKIKAKATQFAKSFKNTIHGLFYTKVFDVDEKGNKKQVEIATPLKRWIDRVATGLIDAIKTFILNIPEYIKTGIKAVGSAGRFIAEGIRGLFNHEDAEKALEDETNKITLSGVFSALGDIAATLFNEIVSLFTNTDDMQKNFEWVGQKILGFITSIPSLIGKGIEGITFGFGTIWEWIYDKIVGTGSDGKESELMKFIDENFGENASDNSFIGKIKKIPDLLRSAVEDIKTMFSSLWESILGINIGTKTVYGIGKNGYPGLEEVPVTLGDKFEEIKKTISDFIENLPQHISEAWDTFRKDFSDAWEKVLSIQVDTTTVDGKEVPVTLGDKINQYKEVITAFVQDIPGTITRAWESAKSGFAYAWNKLLDIQVGTKTVYGIGKNGFPGLEEVPVTLGDKLEDIKKTVTDFISNLPQHISEAWDTFRKDFSDAWEKVLSIQVDTTTVDGKEVPVTLSDKIKEYKDAIWDFVTHLPEHITTAWESVKSGFSYAWNKLLDIQVGTKTVYGIGKNGFPGLEEVPVTLGNKLEDIKKTVTDFISNLPQHMQDAWDSINTKLGNFWDNLVGAFTGTGDEKADAEKTFGDRLIDVLANIPAYLTTGLEKAVNSIGAVFKWLTDAMTASMTEADPAKKLAEVTEATLEGAEGKVADDVDKNSPEGKFFEAISSLGQSIMTLITTTIPDFISRGFEWVRTNWNDPEHGWKKSLISIFENLTGIDASDISLGSIGEAVKGAIMNLPTIITNAFNDVRNYISNLFNKKNKEINIKKPGTPKKTIVDDMIDQYTDTGTGSYDKDDSILSGITGFFDSLANGISSFINGLGDGSFGDTIWKALRTFFTTTLPGFLARGFVALVHDVPILISNFISEFKKAASEEIEKDKKDGDMSGGIASLEAGSSLIDMFTSVIEQVIGSIEGIKKIFFDENNNLTLIGKIIGIIGILIMIITAVKGLHADVVENKKETAEAKSSAGFYNMIKWFLIFLTAITTLIGVLANLDNDKINMIMEDGGIFDKITTFVYHLMDFLAIVTIIKNLPEIVSSLISGGQAIGDLFKGIGDLFGKGKDGVMNLWSKFNKKDGGDDNPAFDVDAIVDQLSGESISSSDLDEIEATAESNANSILDSFLGPFTTLLEGGAAAVSADMLGTAFNDIYTQILGNIGITDDALLGFSGQLDAAITAILAVKDKIGEAVATVRLILDLVGLIVQIGVQRSDVSVAATTIYSLNGALYALTLPFTGDIHAAEIVKALEDITGLTDEMGTFTDQFADNGKLASFKQAMVGLGAALSTFNFVNTDNIQSLTTEQIDAIADIMSQLLNNNKLMALIEEAGTKFGESEKFSKGADNLILFSNAFSRLASGVTSITEETKNNLTEFFSALTEISLEMTTSDEDGNKTLVSFSGNMISLGTGIANFCDTLKDIKEVDFGPAEKALDLVIGVARQMSGIGVGVLQKAIAGGTELRDFGPILSGFAPHLRTFINTMQPETDAGELDYAYVINAMYALDHVVKAAGSLQYSGNGIDNLKKLLTYEDDAGNSIPSLLASFVSGFFESVAVITYTLKGNNSGLEISEITVKTNEIWKYIDNVQILLTAFGYFFESVSKLANVDMGKVIQDLTEKKYGKHDVGVQSAINYLVNAMLDAFTTITKGMHDINDENVGERWISISDINDFFDLMSYYFEILNRLAFFANETRAKYDEEGKLIGLESAYSNFSNPVDVIEFLVGTIGIVKDHVADIFGMVDALAVYDNDGDKIKNAISVLSVLKELGTVLMLFGSGLDVTGANSKHYEYFNEFSQEGLASFQAFADNIGVFTQNMNTVVDRLSEFYEQEEVAEKLKRSGSIMASKLFIGIQEAFQTDPDFRPKITPILDDSALRQQMGELFGLENPSDFNFGSGFSDAVSSAFGSVSRSDTVTAETFTLKLDEIGGKLDNMDTNFRTSIDSIATSFNGAKLIVDREAFVMSIGPYVDAYLSNIGYLHINHNATGNITMSPG